MSSITHDAILAIDGHVFNVVQPWSDSFRHDCGDDLYYIIGTPAEGWTCSAYPKGQPFVVTTLPRRHATPADAFADVVKQLSVLS